MLAFLHALGGVALILFGVRFLRKGLDKLVGPRLPVWVGRLTGGPVRAAVAGVGVGLVAPSTSTQGLLAVSLVRDGLIGLRRAILFIMGAYLGATLLIHLFAADVASHAPIGLLVGLVLFQGTRGSTSRGLGQIIVAVSFVLLGVGIVSGATAGLAASEDLRQVTTILSDYPWLAALVAAVVTAVVHSTTATLAVVIAIAINDPNAATPSLIVAFVCGANVGVSAIAVVAGWGQVDSRRFSLAAGGHRLALAAVLLIFTPASASFVDRLPGSPVQRLATAHTAFNALALLAAAPLAPLLASFVKRVVRANGGRNGMEPEAIDDRWADDPGMAFAQTKREIGIAVRVTVSMLRDAWTALESRDEALLREVRERDDTVDRLEAHVKSFLTRQLTDELAPSEVRRRILQLRFIGDLEAVADVIDRRICETAMKASRRGVRFSDEGFDELRDMFDQVASVVELAGATFLEERPELARRLLRRKDEVRDLELRLRERHYERLQEELHESFETTGLHLEILGQLKHIAHVIAGVAYGVLDAQPSRSPPDERDAL